MGNVTGAMVFQGSIPVSVGLLGTEWDLGDDRAGDDGPGGNCDGPEPLAGRVVRALAPLVAQRQRAAVPWVHIIFVQLMARKSPQRSVRPVLGLTMGDPAGIGPEVIAKALADKALARLCQPVVIGSRQVMERTIKWLDLPLEVVSFDPQSVRD